MGKRIILLSNMNVVKKDSLKCRIWEGMRYIIVFLFFPSISFLPFFMRFPLYSLILGLSFFLSFKMALLQCRPEFLRAARNSRKKEILWLCKEDWNLLPSRNVHIFIVLHCLRLKIESLSLSHFCKSKNLPWNRRSNYMKNKTQTWY